MPYAKGRKCPHGWYAGVTDISSSALFNTSTECPKCRAAARMAEKRHRAALTPVQRKHENDIAAAKLIAAAVVTGLVILVTYLVIH